MGQSRHVPLPPATRLGLYEILALLGAGSAGRSIKIPGWTDNNDTDPPVWPRHPTPQFVFRPFSRRMPMSRTPAGLSAALFAALFAATLITAALFAGCASHDSPTRPAALPPLYGRPLHR